MAAVGEKYRLKKIKGEWYEVIQVGSSSVVLRTPSNLDTIVALDTLKKDYTKDK
jgi:hypothetical protein